MRRGQEREDKKEKEEKEVGLRRVGWGMRDMWRKMTSTREELK